MALVQRPEDETLSFRDLQYEGDAAEVFSRVEAHRKHLEDKNRGASTADPAAVPLGLVGGGGWASVNSLAMLAALADAGLLGGLHTIVCTSNGANTTAYALADQVHQASAFFVRKAIVHRTLAPVRNFWRYGRPVNTDYMSQLVAGRLSTGGEGRRRGRTVVEALADPATPVADGAARAAKRKGGAFLRLDTAHLLKSGPQMHVTLTHAETGEGFTVPIDGREHPVIPLSAAITLPLAYPSKVVVRGRPAIDGGFALSNLPLTPALDILARARQRPSAVLAILNFSDGVRERRLRAVPVVPRVPSVREQQGPRHAVVHDQDL